MIKILLDMTKSETDISVLVPGIKMFLGNKHPEPFNLTIYGPQDKLLTLRGENTIGILDVEKATINIGENEQFIGDESLRKCLSLLNNKELEYDIFVTFAHYSEIKKAVTKCMSTKTSPILASRYPNAYTGKMTLIGDLGYKSEPKFDDFVSYLKKLRRYSRKVLAIDNPSIKFLLPSSYTPSEDIEQFLNYLKEEVPNYQGEVDGKDLLTADCDILLGDPLIIQSIMAGINQGIKIYNDYLERGMNGSFQYKFGGIFIKKLLQTFESSIDRKLTSGGTVLLGLDKRIICVNPDTTLHGISACLELAYKNVMAINKEKEEKKKKEEEQKKEETNEKGE